MKLLIVWLCLLVWVILASGSDTNDTTVEAPVITQEPAEAEPTKAVDPVEKPDGPQQTITVSVVLRPPWVSTTEDKTQGFMPDLLRALGQRMKVNFTIRQVGDGKYGKKLKGKKWNGVMAEVQNREADMGGLLRLTDARREAVSFSKSVISSSVHVISQRDQNEIYKADVFFVLRPLSAGVWLLVFFSFVVVGALLFLFRFFGNNSSTDDYQTRCCKYDPQDEYWFAFVVLMWQGAYNSPKSTASRILTGFWLLFILLTILFYVAALVDHLSVSWPIIKPVKSIRSLDELLNQDRVQYGAADPSFTMNVLKEADSGKYKPIYDHIRSQHTHVYDFKEGLEKVRGGNYALFLDSIMSDLYLNQNCDIVKVGQLDYQTQDAFVFPQDSTLVSQVNDALDELQKKGTINELYNKWIGSRNCPPVAEPSDVRVPVAVTPAMFAGPVILLIIGIVISVLVFEFQILYHKCKKQGGFASKNKKDVEEGNILLEEEEKLGEVNQAVEVENEAEEQKEPVDEQPKEESESPKAEETTETKETQGEQNGEAVKPTEGGDEGAETDKGASDETKQDEGETKADETKSTDDTKEVKTDTEETPAAQEPAAEEEKTTQESVDTQEGDTGQDKKEASSEEQSDKTETENKDSKSES